MKILQIVKTSDGANWAFDQAKWLQNNGIEIITVLPDKKGKIAQKYIKNNMKIIISDFSLPVFAPWKFLKRKKEIKEIIKKEKPDIIHMHFVTNAFMVRIAQRKDNIPKLFQVPGPLHLENRIIRKLEIKSANKYDYWAPSCIKSKQIYLKENINPSRVFLAYYGGYGGKSIGEYTKGSNILHEQYNISNDTILIGMISYFYKPRRYLGQTKGIKGHEDFIDAISILIKDNPNIKGIIIGGAWGKSNKYEEKVHKYAEEKCGENIIFTGFRNDIKKIYKELDIAVHPSHSENLGGAAESLAAEIPTIATNIGGFPDIVIDGQTGYLCEVSNPQSIVDNINKILKDKEKAEVLAKNGQRKVKELLDINNTSKKIYNIYQKIIKETSEK